MDSKIVMVALSGLENILRFGSVDGGAGTNPYAVQIEECYGLDKIEFLQSHENLDIYKKVLLIIILARQLINWSLHFHWIIMIISNTIKENPEVWKVNSSLVFAVNHKC